MQHPDPGPIQKILAIVFVSLFVAAGCGHEDAGTSAQAPDEAPASDVDSDVEQPVQIINGIEVYAYPPEEDNPDLIAMPDGMHLQPGVEVHELQPGVSNFVVFDEDQREMVVGQQAIEYFEGVKRGHVIHSDGEFLLIVESIEREGDVLVAEVSPFNLARVVWGNWRIPLDIDWDKVADEHDFATVDKVSEGEVLESDAYEELTTARQQSLPAEVVNLDLGVNFGLDRSQQLNDANASISIDAQVEGQVRATGKMELSLDSTDSQFVGRIGSYREDYDCGASGFLGWIKNRYCVDEFGVQLHFTGDREFGLKGQVSGGVGFEYRKKLIDALPIVPIPIGPTSITANLLFTFTTIISGGISAEASYEMKQAASLDSTFGFNFKRANRNGNGPENRLETWPKRGQAGGGSDPVTQEFEMATGVLNLKFAAVASFRLGVGVGANTLEARGPELKGTFSLEGKYAPGGLTGVEEEGEHRCWDVTAELSGAAVPRLEFVGSLGRFQKKISLLCDNDDPERANCVEATVGPFKLGNWGGEEGCHELFFDTLIIDVESTDSPIGVDDIEGQYDVLAICKERFYTGSGQSGRRNGEVRKVCVTSHGGKLTEAPSSCPIDSSNAVGLSTGRHEFSFGESIQRRDVITIDRSHPSGGCFPSGRARAFLKNGDREVELTDGPVDGTISESID